MRLDPIRLAIPQVSKDTCREFWGSCLQFNQIEKPENLKLRGGAWFRKEAVEIHLGPETPISAAKKAIRQTNAVQNNQIVVRKIPTLEIVKNIQIQRK